jgi:hypothetical protein
MTQKCPPNEWHNIALALREIIVTKGLYVNAPIIYKYKQIDKQINEYTVFAPINAEISVAENMPFSFLKELCIEDALVFRLADLEAPGEIEAQLLLQACAESQGCKLEIPFYNICLNVFDEIILDIVAPISKPDNTLV